MKNIKVIIGYIVAALVAGSAVFMLTAESQFKAMGLNTIQNYSVLYVKLNEDEVSEHTDSVMRQELACAITQYHNLKQSLIFMTGKGPFEDVILAEAKEIANGAKCPWLPQN